MDSTTTTSQDRRLCGDILRLVFDQYEPYETVEHPLETLLLVCRYWRDAALSHGRLWSRFRIHVEHEDTHEILLRRTFRRLKRSGTAPMDIDLLNLLDIETSPVAFEAGYNELPPGPSWCPFDDYYDTDPEPCEENRHCMSCFCSTAAYECACKLLDLLAGHEGEHCRRWKTLTFYPSYGIQRGPEEALIARALSHPTPLLESLSLHHITSQKKILPSTPSLVQLGLDNCHIPCLVGTANLRFAGISWDLDSLKPGYLNKANLKAAIKLETLRIGVPEGTNMVLPPDLPKLRELQLCGEELLFSMRTMKMEGLRHLVIGVNGVVLISQLGECVDHAFWRVNKLTLWYEHVEQGDCPGFKGIMSQLFKLFTGLDVLRGDRKMLGLAIKLMWEQIPTGIAPMGNAYHVGSARIFGEREIELRRMFDGEPRQRLSHGAGRQDLVDVAAQLGVVDPGTDWGTLFHLLGEQEVEEEPDFLLD